MTQNNYKTLLFLFFICTSLILISFDPEKTLYPRISYDEKNFYQPAVQGMKENGVIEHLTHNPDTKPLPFMYLWYLADGNIIYPRMLNYILIIITTILIYKITGSKLSILYPLVPIFMDGGTLTAEIIKAMFLIASLYYIRYNGILLGISMIFNPWSILYGLILRKKQLVYFIIIGEIFAGILLYLGLFWSYLIWLIKYEAIPQESTSWFVIMFMAIFFIIGSKDKTILKYALLSTIPVLTRPFFDHYYIVPFSILFVGYLLEMRNHKIK